MSQVVLGGIIAYFLTERWQRWRQRRDFQFRVMSKFGELSEECFHRLTELLMGHGSIPAERHIQLRREYSYRKGILLAMDGEMSLAFKDSHVFSGLIALRDIMVVLFRMACRIPPTPRAEFERVQDSMLAQRRLMIARMGREMGFLSWTEIRAAVKTFAPKAALPDDVTPPTDSERNEQQGGN